MPRLLLGGREGSSTLYRVEQKTLQTSVTHVLSGLMGCALAAWVSGQEYGGKIQTCNNFFARPSRHACGSGAETTACPLFLPYLPLYFCLAWRGLSEAAPRDHYL